MPRRRSRSKSKSKSSVSRASSVSTRGKKRRSKKRRGGRGKRKMNPFMVFSNKERAKLRKQKPNASIVQIAKELGKRWRKMSEQEKARYGGKSKGKGKSKGRGSRKSSNEEE